MTMTKPTSEQVTFLQAGAGATQRTALAKLRDTVSVKDFGAVGDGVTDDTAAIQACVEAAKNGTNKNIYIPFGTYMVQHIDMIGLAYSNISFIGEGLPTIKFKLPAGGRVIIPGYPDPTFARTVADGIFAIDGNVQGPFADDTLSIKNIRFSGIKFLMDVVADGFDQLMHCVVATGISGIYFDHCQFVGFMGDGIAISISRGPGSPSNQYNKNLVVTNCIFDGINKNNRQAISIYYCDGFTIMDNVFKNTTRADMPGAIDLEPDNDIVYSRSGIIWRNSFTNIGGIGAITIEYRNSTSVARQIDIAYNTFDNIDGEIFYAGVGSDPGGIVLGPTREVNLSIRYNNCRNFGDVFSFTFLSGIVIENNTFSVSTTSVSFNASYNNIERCENVIISNNDFDAVRPVLSPASTGGLCIGGGVSGDAQDNPTTIINNRFYNCGEYAITMLSRFIGEIRNNQFVSSTDANPWAVFGNSDTVDRFIKLSLQNNTLLGTFLSGTNGAKSINKLLFISGGTLPTSYNSKTPETFDYGTTIFQSTGVWPEVSPPAATNGSLVTTRLKDATTISVTQYFYPAYNDTALPVYYRHAASTTTWQAWRKFTQTVV
jgi:hypothetical protein